MVRCPAPNPGQWYCRAPSKGKSTSMFHPLPGSHTATDATNHLISETNYTSSACSIYNLGFRSKYYSPAASIYLSPSHIKCSSWNLELEIGGTPPSPSAPIQWHSDSPNSCFQYSPYLYCKYFQHSGWVWCLYPFRKTFWQRVAVETIATMSPGSA